MAFAPSATLAFTKMRLTGSAYSVRVPAKSAPAVNSVSSAMHRCTFLCSLRTDNASVIGTVDGSPTTRTMVTACASQTTSLSTVIAQDANRCSLGAASAAWSPRLMCEMALKSFTIQICRTLCQEHTCAPNASRRTLSTTSTWATA